MNIYDKSNKELRGVMKGFGKTIYGKITFILSYSLFFILFLITLISLAITNISIETFLFAILTLIVFILGSIHYYKELKDYSSSKDCI